MLDLPLAARRPGAGWNGHRILDLHRIRRHAHLRPPPPRGPHPILDRVRRAIGHLQGIDLARRTPGDQGGLQRRPRRQPGPDPAGDRRGPRGINLQKFCFNLFHYDIPWNPARLEQRNGRIDRKLQPAPTVYCRYFLYENREEDTILRRIVEKTENIYRELGGFGTVLDKNLIQTLRRRGIERARVRDTIQMLDFQDDEEEQARALALAEVSGEDDELPTSETRPVDDESDRERIDRRRREKLDKSLDRCARSWRRAAAGSISANPSSAPRWIVRSGSWKSKAG